MALVVETGTGMASADAYVSVEDADSYHSSFGNAAWSKLAASVKETTIRRATRDIDLLYGALFESERSTDVQALAFPRVAFAKGNLTVESNEVPDLLKKATLEMALLIATGFDPSGPVDDSGRVIEDQKKVGNLEIKKRYEYTVDSNEQRLRKVRLLLGPLLTASSSTSSSNFAPIVRG